MSSLTQDQVAKVSKVLLFDSEHTISQWSILVDRLLRMAQAGHVVEVPMETEHMLVPRINYRDSGSAQGSHKTDMACGLPDLLPRANKF